jgi:hypothetical protein
VGSLAPCQLHLVEENQKAFLCTLLRQDEKINVVMCKLHSLHSNSVEENLYTSYKMFTTVSLHSLNNLYSMSLETVIVYKIKYSLLTNLRNT